ncbi:hypothetical protein Pelo_1327 [Pelomyxa schiedti]|nr:hypothetical protein Pelo_1327 [Pelomyxa schiedti]
MPGRKRKATRDASVPNEDDATCDEHATGRRVPKQSSTQTTKMRNSAPLNPAVPSGPSKNAAPASPGASTTAVVSPQASPSPPRGGAKKACKKRTEVRLLETLNDTFPCEPHSVSGNSRRDYAGNDWLKLITTDPGFREMIQEKQSKQASLKVYVPRGQQDRIMIGTDECICSMKARSRNWEDPPTKEDCNQWRVLKTKLPNQHISFVRENPGTGVLPFIYIMNTSKVSVGELVLRVSEFKLDGTWEQQFVGIYHCPRLSAVSHVIPEVPPQFKRRTEDSEPHVADDETLSPGEEPVLDMESQQSPEPLPIQDEAGVQQQEDTSDIRPISEVSPPISEPIPLQHQPQTVVFDPFVPAVAITSSEEAHPALIEGDTDEAAAARMNDSEKSSWNNKNGNEVDAQQEGFCGAEQPEGTEIRGEFRCTNAGDLFSGVPAVAPPLTFAEGIANQNECGAQPPVCYYDVGDFFDLFDELHPPFEGYTPTSFWED